MRLFLAFICSLFTVAKARKDFQDTCLKEKSCVLPCSDGERLSKVTWSKDMLALQWFPASDIYHQHGDYRGRTSLFVHEIPHGNCSLLISHVKLKDEGVYKCVTTSQSGREEQLFHTLTVSAPVDQVVVERSGDSLLCRSGPVHPEPECSWSGAFSNSTLRRDVQSLYFINCTTPLLRNDSLYHCRVSTPFSAKSATYRQLSPITVSGSEASLGCAPPATPVKTVTWSFNNTEVIANLSGLRSVPAGWRPFVRGISELGSLSLENLTSKQQGRFTCVASTDTDTHTVSVWLQIKEPESVSHVAAAAVITATVLTVFTLAAFRCCQTNCEAPAPDAPPPDPRSGSTAAPRDRFRAARVACGLLGLASVLPWHSFLTASLYFQQRFRQNWLLSCIAAVSFLPRLLHEAFRCRAEQRTLTSLCLVSLTLIFIVMLVCVRVPMSGTHFLSVSISAIWLASLLCAHLQRRLYAEVALLPQTHRNTFASGQACAGVVAAVVMIVCAALTEDADTQVFCHFLFASVVSTAALVAYVLLPCLEFAEYHLDRERRVREDSPLELLAEKCENNNQRDEPLPTRNETWRGVFCVVLVPILTFSVHPGITVDVHAAHGGTWGRYFVLVCCFLNFHVCHWIGQKIGEVSRARKHFLFIFTVFVCVHTAFVPLFMFCNVQPRAVLPVSAPLSHDASFAVIVSLFSCSDGFLTHLLLSRGAGVSDYSWTVLGGTIGAFLSFGFRAAI